MTLNKSYIYIQLMVLAYVSFSITACNQKHRALDPDILVHLNKFQINWHGQARLEGVFPILENSKLKYHQVHKEQKDSTFHFQFLHNFQDHLGMKAVISPKKNLVILYLSPNDFHTKKTTDFIGIFFEKIPQLSRGLAIISKGSEITKHTFVTNTSLPDNGIELLVWKYEDGQFAACIPLEGKGYDGSLGKYQNLVGVKSYDAEDGSNETDIPMLAIAFARTSEAALTTLLHETEGIINRPQEFLKQTSISEMTIQ